MTQARDRANTQSITVADISLSDQEERVSHKRLASALGMVAHHKLRHLIERNLEEFQRYGAVPSTMDETTARGGRPGQIVWLNEGQAILAAVRSDAPRAADVRHQVITAFMEYRRSKLGLVPVKAHERRTSTRVDDAIRLKRNIDRLERATAQIHAIAEASQPRFLSAMVVDGEPVVVDVADHDIRNGERAVVILADGRVSIEPVSKNQSGVAGFGERSALGSPYRGKDGGTHRDGVVIVGKVLERWDFPTASVALPRSTRIRSAEIIPLLRAGLTPLQVAARTGAHENTVYRWRKRMAG